MSSARPLAYSTLTARTSLEGNDRAEKNNVVEVWHWTSYSALTVEVMFRVGVKFGVETRITP